MITETPYLLCFRRLFNMTRWIGIWILSIFFFCGISAGWALDLNLPETAYQGDLVVGRSEPTAHSLGKGSTPDSGSARVFRAAGSAGPENRFSGNRKD